MIPEITDKNLYLLLPGKVSAVVELYVQNHGGSLLDGLSAYSGDTRSPIPVISVHSVGNLQYRRQS